MNLWRCGWLAAAVLALSGCGQDALVDTASADAYAVQLPVTRGPGEAVQRVALPAAALVAVRRDDLGDIRLFDARGRRMALALADNAALAGRQRSDVPLFPVSGLPGAAGRQDVIIRLDNGTAVEVVSVGQDASARGAAPATNSAVLLDTRAVRQPVQTLLMEADIPAGRPVTLTVQSSANLRDWRMEAETTLFRPQGSDQPLGDGRLPLDGADVANRYLIIRWPDGEPVRLRAAQVETVAAGPVAPIEVETDAPILESPHIARFDLPPTAPIEAVRVRQGASDGVLPLRLLGRSSAEQPWTLLSAATLRPGEAGVLLSGLSPAMRQFRVEADQRTAGWTTAPRLSLRFRPVTLIADLSGTPPYRLAVGQAQAASAYLDPGTLLPGAAGAQATLPALPAARVDAPAQPAPRVALVVPDADGPLAPRKLALWAALLVGVAVLALVAWRLAKGLPARPLDPA